MIKFCVKGDLAANPFYSSSIIINNLNSGAKNVDLYDENGKVVVYSTTCDDYGHYTDAFLCVYETCLPFPIIQNARGRPIIGCSLDNLFFITDAYHQQSAAYCQLGVDSQIFKPAPRNYAKDKFRFLVFSESNARSGIDTILLAFATAFENNPNVELYLKDRGATDIFKAFVAAYAQKKNIKIIHDTENTQNFEEVKKIYQDADFQINISRSSTWNMPCLEGMSMGLPLVGIDYSGMAEYLRHLFNGIAVPYNAAKIEQAQLDELASWGFRNHMFPLNSYASPAYWAETDVTSLAMVLKNMTQQEPTMLNTLSRNARITAESFTWGKAASSLSAALTKLYG